MGREVYNNSLNFRLNDEDFLKLVRHALFNQKLIK